MCQSFEQKTQTQEKEVTRKRHPRNPFTPYEDVLLTHYVEKHGTTDWNIISTLIGSRNARQCKERWTCFLSPTLNKEIFTQEEDDQLLSLYSRIGSDWKKISHFFCGRSPVFLRNRVMLLLRKEKKANTHKIIHTKLNQLNLKEPLISQFNQEKQFQQQENQQYQQCQQEYPKYSKYSKYQDSQEISPQVVVETEFPVVEEDDDLFNEIFPEDPFTTFYEL